MVSNLERDLTITKPTHTIIEVIGKETEPTRSTYDGATFLYQQFLTPQSQLPVCRRRSQVDPTILPFDGKANRRLAILDTDKKEFELHLTLDLIFT
ncbi:hypothetical protein XPA_000891 [Xanthoria parietina]